MGTSAMEKLSAVTRHTQDLESFFRKPIVAQPAIEVTATMTNFSTVFSSIAINMVYSQNIRVGLATAGALITIGYQDFLAEISIPSLVIVFLTRLKAKILKPIAVSADKLKAIFRKIILAEPVIETVATANLAAMISTVIINVINREKGWMRLATINTNATIGRENFITKLVPRSLTNR